MEVLRGSLGIVGLLGIAVALSRNRRAINWRLVLSGLGFQLLFGLLVLKVDAVYHGFRVLSQGFVKLLAFTDKGSQFVFGNLVDPQYQDTFGMIFAFKILPIIIFFSALSSALYHLGVLQWIVYGMAWVMSRTMRLSGAESLSAAGNVFLGQTEAPLLVKPYLNSMSRSELMCIMTGGMATIAGSVLTAFIRFLGGDDPQLQQLFATHLLTASIMSAPAAIVMAKVLVPEQPSAPQDRQLKMDMQQGSANLLDALTIGTRDGLRLAVNVGAILITFLAVVAMLNYFLAGLLGDWTGLNDWVRASTDGRFDRFSLEYLVGQAFRPLAFLIGVDWSDSLTVGSLLGQKTVINEFKAFRELGKLEDGTLSLQSRIIATYALCGFANLASIGIQIGGISSIAPAQRQNLSSLGFLALVGGTLACLMTACWAGMLVELP
jgi:CNT family concentrative nucleoside transporter